MEVRKVGRAKLPKFHIHWRELVCFLPRALDLPDVDESCKRAPTSRGPHLLVRIVREDELEAQQRALVKASVDVMAKQNLMPMVTSLGSTLAEWKPTSSSTKSLALSSVHPRCNLYSATKQIAATFVGLRLCDMARRSAKVILALVLLRASAAALIVWRISISRVAWYSFWS